MKKIKISIIAVIAIVMGVAGSAFSIKSTDTIPDNSSYFYVYTSNSTAQVDIQNSANYVRSPLSCDPGTHVCGVSLPTNKPLGQPPVQSEFDDIADDLWDSEINGHSVNPAIKMRK